MEVQTYDEIASQIKENIDKGILKPSDSIAVLRTRFEVTLEKLETECPKVNYLKTHDIIYGWSPVLDLLTLETVTDKRNINYIAECTVASALAELEEGSRVMYTACRGSQAGLTDMEQDNSEACPNVCGVSIRA